MIEASTLLHRQVHPNFVQNGVISSQTFYVEEKISSLSFQPTDKDEGKLSVYNGSKFSALEAFLHFVNRRLQSKGVLSVSKDEVDSIGDLSAFEDNDPFDGHSVIDYSRVTGKASIKKKAAKLRDIAVSRGWTYKV